MQVKEEKISWKWLFLREYVALAMKFFRVH